ncbi:MAG: hypothetical protein M3256_24665 [Actinomycetota bacterium]|nr:hypothetical protein [Actinomycetota bacterium]
MIRTLTLVLIFVAPLLAAAVVSLLLQGGVDALSELAASLISFVAVVSYAKGHPK